MLRAKSDQEGDKARPPVGSLGLSAHVRTFDHTPNAEMAELHDHLPVILEHQDLTIWLGEADALPDSGGHPTWLPAIVVAC